MEHRSPRPSSQHERTDRPDDSTQHGRRPKHRISFIDTVLESPATDTEAPPRKRPEPLKPLAEPSHAQARPLESRHHRPSPPGPHRLARRRSSIEDVPMDGSSGPLSDQASSASANSPAHPGPTAPLGLETYLDTDTANASSRSLRTLLPGPLDEGGRVNHPAKKKALAGRVQVAAACLACRKRKVKCNGARPICTRCIEQNLSCVYDSEPDSTRMLTLKRRQRDLETEVEDLRQLYTYVRTRPEQEAHEIFRRIRFSGGDDFRSIVDHIRSGDLLLRASTISHGPDDHRVKTINDEAAAEPYAIRVPARPWTTMAGDGLVSELIGAFFAWDGVFWLPFIDRGSFIKDMRGGQPEKASYCSPLLVHVICAIRASTSPRAKALGMLHGFDMRERFLDEAKDILDKELGRISLPTIWALAIMFVCSSTQGQDRAGMMYRFTAFEMLKKMRLPQRLEKMRAAGMTEEAELASRIYSRALWGMYAFESCAAFVYLSTAAFPRPTIPRLFHDGTSPKSRGTHGFPDDSSISAAVLDASCDFADIYNEVMIYNHQIGAGALGGAADVNKRIGFYHHVQERRYGLPDELRPSSNFSPATYYLDCYADQTILAIFRPLHVETRLPMSPPSTAGEICIASCETSVIGAERYEREFHMKTQGYSAMAVYPLYNAVFTLVAMLRHRAIHDLFARTCRLLAEQREDYPITMYCLQGVQAMADKMNIPIPDSARPSFSILSDELGSVKDVPISFVLPGWDDMVEVLVEDGMGYGEIGVEMGTLIAKWNAMSTT